MNIKLNPEILSYNGNVAIVMGGAYVNALHIIRALGNNVPIISVNEEEDPGGYSKFVDQRIIDSNFKDKHGFLKILISIGEKLQNKAVLFPTSDLQIRFLIEHYENLTRYYFIPVNPKTSIHLLSKENQYKLCSEIGIPYPKTNFINTKDDIDNLMLEADNFIYPLIIKPSISAENTGLFKIKEIHEKDDLYSMKEILISNLKYGFVVSEMIPGEPDNIWIYMGYIDSKYNVVAGWTAKKLTQRPFYFGVFSTVRYEKNKVVEDYGKLLSEKGEYVGICEPEFKYDQRDNKYKLIEINPRYMMFNGVGVKGGINLPLIHYYHCVGEEEKLKILNKKQDKNTAHLIYMFHEMMNILDHQPKRKFIKSAFFSIFRKNKVWGILDISDLRPVLIFNKLLFMHIYRKFYKKFLPGIH